MGLPSIVFFVAAVVWLLFLCVVLCKYLLRLTAELDDEGVWYTEDASGLVMMWKGERPELFRGCWIANGVRCKGHIIRKKDVPEGAELLRARDSV